MDPMFIPFIIVGFLCLIPCRNKKINFCLTIMAVVIIIGIFAFNNKSVDQFAYDVLYKDKEYFEVEKGYIVLCEFFKILGASYAMFKFIFAAILSLLLYLRFKKYEFVGFRLALLSYFLSSYCFDAEQSRFTFAGIIVVLASWLLEKRGIIRIILYVCAVALATTIHTSCAFYIFLLFVKFKNKPLLIMAGVFSFLTLVIGALKPDLSFIGNLIYKIIPNERILMWFNFETNFGWVGPFATYLLFYGALEFSRRAAIHNDKFSENQKSIIEFCYKTCLILFIAAPLNCFATDFIRIIRIFIPLYLAVIAMVMMKSAGLERKWPYAIFLILFPIFFAVQGKRGLLAYNNYYCSTLVLKNDFLKNIGTIVLCFFIVLAVFVIFARLTKPKKKKMNLAATNVGEITTQIEEPNESDEVVDISEVSMEETHDDTDSLENKENVNVDEKKE